jgi:signal transduction histidine kinase
MTEEEELPTNRDSLADEKQPRSMWLSVRLWLIILASCTVLGALEGTQAWLGSVGAGGDLTWRMGAASTMPSWYMLALLAPAIFWVARKFPLDEKHWKTSILVHLPLAVVFTFVHLRTSNFFSDWLLYGTMPPLTIFTPMSTLLGLYFMVEIFFYAMIVGVAHALAYRKRYRERERAAAQLALKASRLEGSLTRANLESLRMQLNPHFLFNTLNAISVMALKGERHGVVRTLTLLSDLLRVSLENNAQVVPLRDELAFLERYIEIEEIRFKDRLTVAMDIAPSTIDGEVPTLVLQPLVENAIKHGISRKPGAGEIRVRSRRNGQMLVLEVVDTGPGFGKRIEHARTGIGLANTRARLEQLYGKSQSLELEDAPGGGALVRVTVPYRVCPSQTASSAAGVTELQAI